jgi:probable rRNA maturation factor
MSKRPIASKKVTAKKAPAKKAVATKAVAHIIDVATPTAAWIRALPRAAAIARRAARAALEGQRKPCEVSILLAGDAQARQLNRDYRHKDKPTNVLSFPAGAEAAPLLGDVVVAFGVTQREAASERKTLAAHLTHLVIHGVLHLLGYDHIEDRDAAVMERRESALMARMGLSDPYAEAPVQPRR